MNNPEVVEQFKSRFIHLGINIIEPTGNVMYRKNAIGDFFCRMALLIFYALWFFGTSNAQTGPGGVGSSATNKLWLRADTLYSVGNGNLVSTWTDISGNNNNATQAGTNRPTWFSNIINAQPVVRFDGVNDYFTSVFTTASQNSTIFTVFSANHTGSSTPDGPLWQYNAASGTSGFFPLYSNGNQYVSTTAGGWLTKATAFSQNVWSTTTVLYNTGITELWKDGTLNHSAATNSITLGAFSIGRRTVSATNYFKGDIAEIIYYNVPLNTAERIIVTNYLGAKYGIAIANDKYAFEGSHSFDLAGIGYEDATNINSAAKSAGILSINNASSLDTTGDYLLFAHDNGSISSWVNTELPSGDTNLVRLSREWKFDMSGTVGTVSLAIDTALLPVKPANFDFYLLWVDADGDFTNGATYYPVTLSGGSYVAANVVIPDGGYVMIAAFRPVINLSSIASNDQETTSPVISIFMNYPASAIITVPYYDAGTGTAIAGDDYSLPGSSMAIPIGNTSASFTLSIINDTIVESDETVHLGISTPDRGILGSNSTYTYTINDDDNARKIEFSVTSSGGNENISTVSITIQINNIDSVNPTTVNYAVTGGTATGGGVDYTLASGTATILPNDSTINISLNVTEDLINETNETVIITLSNPTNSNLGANSVYTYTIIDNDSTPVIQFLNAASTGIEGVSPSVIYVTLSAPSGQNVTVDYADAGTGSATGGGVDYIFTGGTLTIPAGSTSANFNIIIIDDALIESPETINFTLSGPNGATLGAITSHTFTLNDNDVSLGFTGPGGVGNATYNKLWLRADDLTAVGNGNPVSNWTDASGNNNNATQAGGSRPVWVTNVINSRPAVRFDGVNDHYPGVFTVSAQNSSMFTVFSANHTGSASPDGPVWQYNDASINSGFFPRYSNGNQFVATTAAGWITKATTFSQNVWYTTTVLYKTGVTELWQNGTLNDNAATNSISLGSFTIGRRNVGTTNYFKGDISELIYYNTPLNTAQHIIVNNYLAAKYGLTIANDKYAYETTHAYEVAGIGREDAANMHTAAQSAGILKVSNPGSLADNDYLIFGHDNASIISWTTTEAPNGGINTYRIAREWKFCKTGTVGTVSLTVDTTLLPARPLGYNQFVIWVDADGDFSNGAIAYQATLAGKNYSASGITITNGSYVTFGYVLPSVQFASAASSGFEYAAASLPVVLSNACASNVTVNYAVIGGTASSGSDYILASGTLTIFAGQTTANITPAIINDVVLESDETIIILLSSPSSGIVLGTDTVHTYTINDDDNSRKIEFASTSSADLESVATVNITIQVNNTDSVNATTVNYAVSGGTATGGGTDYTFTGGTATIPANSSSVNISLNITEDLISEANETVIISLSGPTNANLGINASFTYTIIDNDSAPVIQFLSAASNGIEGISPSVVYVSLSTPSGQTVTVNYADAGTGSATGGGVDYSISGGTVTIPAGSTTGSFNIAIVDDALIEAPETIDFTLSSPNGATLGTITSHTFTLNDNDVLLGFTGPGGVGNSTYNKLWLRAGDLTSVGNGNPVSTWTDVSGSNNNASQNGGSRPIWVTNAINSRPAVRFDGVNDHFPGVFTGTAQYSSMFAVFSADHTGSSAPDGPVWQYNDASTNSGFFPRYSNGSQYVATTAGGWMTKATTFSQSVWYTSTVLYKAGATELWQNGSLNDNAATNTVSLGDFTIGRRNVGTTNYFKGDIAELIYYNTPLNTAQHIIVNNYLAAKYGLTIVNDKYAFDITYGNEVAGIGREDASNMHLAARSGDILKTSNPSSLGNGDYLIFGHDNGSISNWTSTEAPNAGVNTIRIAREWRFDKTGTVGTVSLSIDTATLPSKPLGYDQYVIWVDADGDFTNGAIEVPANLVGGSYTANGVTVPDNYYVTFGLVRSSVQFTLAASNGLESVLTPIEIKMNYPKATNITVNYTVSAGTATAGSDYIFANGTATFLAGQTSVLLTPSIINDVIVENDETFTITLSSPSGGVVLGTNTVHTFTINDDDNSRKIYFTTTNSHGDEATVSSVNIQVQLNNIDTVNPTTVIYTATGGTATGGGVDYILTSGTLTIPANRDTASFILTIVDDLISEANETVVITLSGPTNSNLGTNTTHTYTIDDNDVQPVVQFTNTTVSGDEGLSPGAMEVSLTVVSGQNITVDYAITGGTATGGGIDYTLSNGTLTIPAGSLTANINAAIIDDALTEITETIQITISNPVGATLGVNTVCTYQILDNDVTLGFSGPGGVGDAIYNKLWLKADDLTAVGNGNQISTWPDASGNGNNASQNGSNRPVWMTNIVNAQPVVRFDGINDYFGSVINVINQNSTMLSVFSANHNGTSSPDGPLWQYNDASNTSGFFPRYSNGSQYVATTAAGWLTKATTFNQNTWYTSTVLYKTSITELWKNGSLNDNASTNSITLGAMTIGRRSVGSSNYYKGDIAELIYYSTPLNTAQHIIVNNYLAAKYGLTIANDKYAWEATHKHEVAGIGYDDANNFHSAAQSAGILKISAASSLDVSGDYMIFGHDNGNIATWTSTEVPSTGIKRLAREWRFDESGTIGTVTVTVDMTLLPGLEPTYNGFILMIDQDGDFTSGAILKSLTLQSGSLYASSNVSIPDGYYVAIGEAQNISKATGNFNSTATWLTGIVPSTGQSATIISPHVVTLTSNQTIGSLSVSSGATLNLGSYTLTLDGVGGTLTVAGTFTPATGTVNYAAAGAQCVTGLTYYNLSMSGSGTKTLCGNTTVTKNLTIGSVTLDVSLANNYSLLVGGNWINTGSFSSRAGTVTMNGTVAQTLTPGISNPFYNLTINNTATTGPQIVLTGPTTVNHTLTLTAGRILATSGNIMNMAAGSTTTIGSSLSYVDGTMSYDVAASGVSNINFPIGKSVSWRPVVLTVTHSSAASATYTAEMFNASAAALGYTLPGTVDKVSAVRYWQIDRTGASNFTNAQTRIYYDSSVTSDVVTDYTNLTVVKTIGSGTTWNDIGGTATANFSGNILSNSFNSFSKFTLANRKGGTNPLPVKTILFGAQYNHDIVEIYWTTSSEINNDFFTVERSADGINYEAITKIPGAGTSTKQHKYLTTDSDPLRITAYYRLRQTDFDGHFEISDPITVHPPDERRKLSLQSVSPNPFNESLIIKFTCYNSFNPMLRIYSLSGALVKEEHITGNTGMNGYMLKGLDMLENGIYFLRISDGVSETKPEKIIKH